MEPNTEIKLMSLGLFVFKLDTLPFDKRQRSTQIKLAKSHAVGRGPRLQHLGLEDDSITISGQLVPPITGGEADLAKLRTMGLKGNSWNLVSGDGEDLGAWFIESIDEDGSHLKADGSPRVIDFTVKLTRDFDEKSLGDLKDSQ